MRLTRVGSKKNPIYRVVVADSRSPRDGKFIEIVGRYNPQTDPSTIEFNEDKVKEWLAKGATPSNTVSRLLKMKNHWLSCSRTSRGCSSTIPMRSGSRRSGRASRAAAARRQGRRRQGDRKPGTDRAGAARDRARGGARSHKRVVLEIMD